MWYGNLIHKLDSALFKKSPGVQLDLNVDIDKLVSDRAAFDAFVYTPVKEALSELNRRWKDKSVQAPKKVPAVFKDGFKAVQAVCVVTPNYQIRRFVAVADAADLTPLIFSQFNDKFTSNNSWKHSLGKLHFFFGMNKKNEAMIERVSILDFNKSNGKALSTVKTNWGENLVDFHHKMFFDAFPHLSEKKSVFDASDWIIKRGKCPHKYYRDFLSLLIKHGVQFENFMLDEKELSFTKEVFLPAFIDIYKKTGLKPLIVALEPTETEGDKFWVSYPSADKKHLNKAS